ncbi:MAG: hypothetical protein U9R42_10145 [Bacteroidota bacterium]|nr:hypothetical protein [Bacteroidota bacterium]
MKLYKLLILFIFAPLLFFTNSDCKKCKDCIYYTDTLMHDQEFLDYWYFPEGSWWVYQRTDTNAIIFDTAVVTKEINKITCLPHFSPYCIHDILLHISHSNIHFKTSSDDPKALLTAFYPPNELTCDGNGTLYFWYGNFFKTPFDLYYQGSVFEISDSLTITTPYGVLENVISIQIFIEVIENVWLKKRLGFVKFQHYDGSIWELVDYFINK